MIEINNLTTSKIELGFLKRVAEKVLKGENKSGTGLSIVLVGEGRIKELNKKYRGKNRATDVLAFGKNTRYKIQDTKYKIQDLGEIVICLREVKKNAKRFDSSSEKELTRVLIHGILHLLGEDHEKGKKEAEKMRKKEEDYLLQFKF